MIDESEDKYVTSKQAGPLVLRMDEQQLHGKAA